MLAFISFFCFQTNAQTFGVKIGLDFANMSRKDNNMTYSNSYKMNPGMFFGGIVDYPLDNMLSLESGLIFEKKGMKYDEVLLGRNVKETTNLYYIDIPITLKATKDFGAGVKLFGTAGPYFDYGLKGKVEYVGPTVTYDKTISWGNSGSDDLRRFDCGLTFGLGLDISSILVGLSYDVGLANISANQSNGMSAKNDVLKFSVGYMFGK